MQTEHEAKALDIDPNAIAARIIGLGGEDLGETLQRRYVYDVIPHDPNKWVRLRDQGNGAVTLTVKHIRHDGIDGTDEIEEPVNSFDNTAALLAHMGYQPRGYQENRRRSFRLGEVQLEIDTWPRIPAYLEIEAATAEAVTATARQLGIDPVDLTSENTTKIYARYGIDLIGIQDLRFDLSTSEK
jgi:adenylate cyclase, class 2